MLKAPYSIIEQTSGVMRPNERTPKKFEFIINLKAAKQIGVTIPLTVLFQANRIIR